MLRKRTKRHQKQRRGGGFQRSRLEREIHALIGGCTKQTTSFLCSDRTPEVIRLRSLQVQKFPLQFIPSLADDFQPLLLVMGVLTIHHKATHVLKFSDFLMTQDLFPVYLLASPSSELSSHISLFYRTLLDQYGSPSNIWRQFVM